MRVGRGE